MHTAKQVFKKSLEKVCLNVDLISFDQRYYIRSYCIFNFLPLPLLHYLDHTGTATWLNCSVAFWSKEKQFLHMVDGVCAVFKNTLNFTTFMKRNRT